MITNQIVLRNSTYKCDEVCVQFKQPEKYNKRLFQPVNSSQSLTTTLFKHDHEDHNREADANLLPNLLCHVEKNQMKIDKDCGDSLYFTLDRWVGVPTVPTIIQQLANQRMQLDWRPKKWK